MASVGFYKLKPFIAYLFILLSVLGSGAKPMFSGLSKWAEQRGRSAIIREWSFINPESKKLIVDSWVSNGDISKEYGNRLLRR